MVISIDDLKTSIDELDYAELEEIANYSRQRLDNLQNEEASAIEKQIQELQSKLNSIRPSKANPEPIRRIVPIVNPNDSSQIYTTGPRPQWLKDLLKEANGDKERERDIMNSLRRKETEE